MDARPKLLRADTVAKILDVSKQRIYELTRERKIPFIQVGDRQYRYNEQAILNWIEAGGTNKQVFEETEQIRCLTPLN